MAFSEAQAARVRAALGKRAGLREKEMFGGIAFLVHGNMVVGVRGEDLIVRVQPSETNALLGEPGAKPFTLAGRGGSPGWLLVSPSGYASAKDLAAWVGRGVTFASTLPAKGAAKKRR